MASGQDTEMGGQGQEGEYDDSLYDDDDIYGADTTETGQQAPVVSGRQNTAMTAYGNPRMTTWQAPVVASYQRPAATSMANVAWATYQAPATASYGHSTAGAGYQTGTTSQGRNVATSVYQSPATGSYSSTAPAAYQPPATGYVGNVATSAYQNPVTASYQNPMTASYQAPVTSSYQGSGTAGAGNYGYTEMADSEGTATEAGHGDATMMSCQNPGTAAYDNTAMTGTEYVHAASAGWMPIETQYDTGTMMHRSSSTNTVLYASERPSSPTDSENTVIYAPSGSQQTPDASSQDMSERARGKRPEAPGQAVSQTARYKPPDQIPIPESSIDLMQIPSLPAAHYEPVRVQQAVSRALLARRDKQGLTAVYPDRLPPDRYLRSHTRFGTSIRLLSPGTTKTVELLDYEIQVGGGLIVNLVWGDRTAPLPPTDLMRHEYEYTSQLGIDTLTHVSFLDIVYIPVKAMVLAAMVATGKAPEGRHVFTPEGEGWDELRRGNSLMALAEQAVGRPARTVEVEGLYLNNPRMKLDDMTVWF